MLFVVALIFGFSHSPANAATGFDYLATQQNPDGSLGNAPSSLATPVQATAESLRAYQALGQQSQSAYAPAIGYLNGDAEANIEFLARKIVINVQAGNATTALINELLTHQNPDGGFGDQAGYDSSAFDAAYALEALAVARYSSGQSVSAAVGYLLNHQQANGGWAVEDNDPSVFVTAQAMRALWHYRYQYTQVPAALNRARDFLLSQRDGSGSWGEDFNTALSLIALVPYLPDTSSVTSSINSLQTAQQSNGSWDNDPYTTALALRALALVSQPQTNPDYAAITGKVVDAQTGLALNGVTVTLSGTASASLITQSNGAFLFEKLPAGSFSLQLSLSNYTSIAVSTLTKIGQTVDLGILTMVKPQNATTGTIKGVVTDTAIVHPLAGVLISVSGVVAPVLTDATGAYQINNVLPGTITVSASLNGYANAVGTANLVAGGILVFSPALTPLPSGSLTTAVEGTVTDGSTGAPLAGASVSVGGAAVGSASTDSQGHYRIEGLTPGSATLTASSGGYDTVTASATLYGGSTLVFSPKLYPSGTTPPNANTAGVTGVVLDAGTSAPLSGVSIVVTSGTFTRTLTSDAQGRFVVDGLTAAQVSLRFTLPGYISVETYAALPPLTTIDIGQVRLRQEQAGTLMPDLTVTVVQRTGLVTDPRTLAVSGTLTAGIANIGTANSIGNVSVLAFYDANHNGGYDDGELVLGSTVIPTAIVANTNMSISIPVAGAVPFRDAPVSVWVDSQQIVTESNELNNVAASSSACQAAPPTQNYTISTVAGNGARGYSGDGGPAVNASFNELFDALATPDGGFYVVDTRNFCIRKVDASGVVSTIAGVCGQRGYNGDNIPAVNALINDPHGMGFDASGNVYIADNDNSRIRKVDGSGIITTIAGLGFYGYSGDGGPAVSAAFNGPDGMSVTVDSSNNLIISDTGNHRLRRITADGIVNTIAGTGVPGYNGDDQPATAAQIYNPFDNTTDQNGNIYFADYSNHRVRRIATDGVITTVAGNGAPGFSGDGGPATAAQLNFPSGLAVDQAGNVYIADSGNNRIRKVSPQGVISTIAGDGQAGYAGDGGSATAARLSGPMGVSIDSQGRLLVGDSQNDRVRRLDPVSSPGVAAPDLTASLVKIIDNGAGQPFSLSVRIGNAGSVASPAGVQTAFYQGDPAASGVLLGTLTLPVIAAADYQDIRLDNVTLNGNAAVHVVIDSTNIVTECNETNNTDNTTVAATSVLGLVSAVTDKSAYGPNSPVILQGLVLNTGSLTSAYNVELRVEDQNGTLVQGFAPQVVTGLGSGNTTTVANNWNTGALLAGGYRLRAILRDAQGRLLDEHAALFTIGINNPTCGQPTINMVATPATIPGDDPANRTPILRFTFEDTSELVPLSSIPAYPETLVNDPSYPAFSPWNELFVANRHGNVPGSAGSIARFTFDEAGNFVANGAITGNSLEAVHGIAFSPWSELFAANLLSGTISRFKFDANGNAIPNGTFHSGTPRAQGLAFSSNGELFITDSVNNPNVQRWRFDPVTRAPIYNGFFSVPGARSSHGLAFDSKGELFIGDIGADRIYRYRFDDAGSAIGNGIIPALDPIGIAFSPAGEMFVTGHASGGISRFLFDQNGNVIPNGVITTPNLGGIAIQPILRNPDNDCIPAATTAITADRPVYDAWDNVALTGRVRNTAPNMILAPSRVELTVRSPFGAVLLNETRPVGELVPGALRDLSFDMALVDAASGTYPVEMVLKDASMGTVLSTSATSFQVQRREIQALTGEVTVSAPQVYQGDGGVCSETAKNISSIAQTGVRLIHQLISVDTGTVVNEVVERVDLAAGGVVYSYFRNIDTTGLSLGGYTCVIKAELNGEEKTLAFGGFKIVEPPVRIAAELRVGSRGRLLVMLDHAAQSPDPTVADSDPFGPDTAPALTAQRAFLEKLLKKAGWSYAITDTSEDFTRELRTGGYSVYALFTEKEKLAEDVQKELREAVFRGEGLLEAGSHDQRQGRVDEALGIKYIGQINNATMIEMTPSPLHAGGQEAFLFNDRVLRAELEGAQGAGRYLGGSGDRRDAVTRHEYGAGKSVYAGFDLLVQATAAGEQSLFAGLILNSLAYVHPASFTAVSGAVVPVDIALTNEGIAAHVKAQFVLPAGAQLTDAGTAQVNNGAMTWEMAMDAGEIKTLKFWLRLPAPNGPLTLMATVEAGANSQTLKLMAEPTLTLTVNDPESLTSVLSRIDALLNNRHPDSQSLKLARKFIEKALGNLHPALAIDDLLKAADSLVDIADPDVVSIRVAIGLWIRWASPYAY